MEWAAVVIGFSLRLGLPLGLTTLLVWWLRRLDARWQMEAEQERWRTMGAVTSRVSMSPCWEIRGCPPERRAACPAFARPEVPCWQVFRNDHGQLKEACLSCVVFCKSPVPAAAWR